MKASKEDQEALRKAVEVVSDLAKALTLARDTDQTRAALLDVRTACISAYDLCNRVDYTTRNRAMEKRNDV